MEYVSSVYKLQSLKALHSAISKSEKALAQMTQKGASTTSLEARLKALDVGLAVLEHVWNQSPHRYTREERVEARSVLSGLLPSIEVIYAKSKVGTPQRTLSERRIKALELAVQAIDELTNE